MQTYKKNFETYFSFIIVAYFALFQTSLGTVMPYFRDEISMSYTVSGLFPSAFAFGMIICGFSADFMINFLSRKKAITVGVFFMAAAYILMLNSRSAYAAIFLCFITGFFGTLSFISGQAVLSDLHGSRRDTALSEANIYAGFFMTVLPFIIGAAVKNGIKWSYSIYFLFIPFLLFFAFGLLKFKNVEESNTTSGNLQTKKLSLKFYLYLFIIFIAISVEWSILFWTPEYLIKHLNFSKANSSISFGFFLAIYIAARITGTYLTSKIKTEKLFYIFIILSFISFPIFWLSENIILSITALMILSFGIANFFPLNLAIIMNYAEGRSNYASGRATLGAGFSIITAPLLLGYAGDFFGIFKAFSIIQVLIIILLLLAFPFYKKKN